jgi:hypothetical protein
MVNFAKSIESKLFKKKLSSSYDAYCDFLFIFAKEFGWTPEEVNQLPLPIALSLMERINKYYEEQSKKIKK